MGVSVGIAESNRIRVVEAARHLWDSGTYPTRSLLSSIVNLDQKTVSRHRRNSVALGEWPCHVTSSGPPKGTRRTAGGKDYPPAVSLMIVELGRSGWIPSRIASEIFRIHDRRVSVKGVARHLRWKGIGPALPVMRKTVPRSDPAPALKDFLPKMKALRSLGFTYQQIANAIGPDFGRVPCKDSVRSVLAQWAKRNGLRLVSEVRRELEDPWLYYQETVSP